MKILDKKELNQIFGKESMWNPKRLVAKVGYISGIIPFDELLEGKLFTEVVALINLRVRPNGLQIEMMKGMKYFSVGISNNDIISINLEDKEQLVKLKDKSVVGRAVIGGLVFGPVGAIVGGMTGLGKKETKAEMPDLILSIRYNENQTEKIILLSCKYKSRNEVKRFMSNNFTNFNEEEPSLNTTTSTNHEKETKGSIVLELEKLVNMKEKGLLSDDEFSLMKSKLLNKN